MKEMLMAALVLLMGLWLSVVSLGTNRDQSRLAKYGVEVQSAPLEGYTERKKGGVTVDYRIKAAFTAKNGGHGNCWGSVDKAMIDRLKENPVVTVRYLPTDPNLEVCQVMGATSESGTSWFLILLGLVLTLGSAAFMYNRWSVQRH